jgi:hypothetical protein
LRNGAFGEAGEAASGRKVVHRRAVERGQALEVESLEGLGGAEVRAALPQAAFLLPGVRIAPALTAIIQTLSKTFFILNVVFY